jgi:hypothetical protein
VVVVLVVLVVLGGVATVVMPNVSVSTRRTAARGEDAVIAVQVRLGQVPKGATLQEVVMIEIVVVVVLVVLVVPGGVAKLEMRNLTVSVSTQMTAAPAVVMAVLVVVGGVVKIEMRNAVPHSWERRRT